MRTILLAVLVVGCGGHGTAKPDAQMLELCGQGYVSPWATELACEPPCAGAQQSGAGTCTINSQVHGALQCGVSQNTTAQFTMNGQSGCCALVDGPSTPVDYWHFYPCQ